MNKILYIPPRGIGDMMFSLPILHSLKSAYNADIFVPIPDDDRKREVHKLVGFIKNTNKNLPVPSQDPLAAARYKASKEKNTALKHHYEKLIFEKYLSGESYDLAIIAKPFTLDNLKADRQISELDLKKYGDLSEMHTVDKYLLFTKELAIPAQINFELSFDKYQIAKTIDKKAIAQKSPYIVLNLSASLKNKKWNPEGFSDVAKYCNDNQYEIVLIGTPEDYEQAKEIMNNSRSTNTIKPDKFTMNFENIARLAYHSKAFISPDTGVLHIADAVGAMTIGLYGPTSPVKYAPYNNKELCISRNHIDKNMSNIQADDIIKILEMKL